MSTDFRFTPASIGAFKHTARDIQQAYGSLTLQQCQEILAKIYGYSDLHALQEHLKTNPKPGPYAHERSVDDQLKMSSRHHAFSAFAPPATRPSGRRGIQDLAVFEKPDQRKVRMAQEALRDAIATGSIPFEFDAPVSDYMVFEVFEQDPDQSITPISRRGGIFEFTEKGYDVFWATLDQIEVLCTECGSEERFHAAYKSLQVAFLKMPNNPYLRSWVTTTLMDGLFPECDTEFDEYLGGEVDDAIALWQAFKACRKMFDGLMPKGFRGNIDPNEAGNEAYFEVLYHGARCAGIAGYRKLALAWARRVMRLNPRDSYGARFLVEALQQEGRSTDE